MISILRGTIEDVREDSIVLMTTGGIGYEIRVHSSNFIVHGGAEVRLYTYLKVSENSMELFGFGDTDSRDFFMLLLSVSGVGPKSAMNILSLGPVDEIKSAIAREDIDFLTAVQGMGKRTAERMVVELKTKVEITQFKEGYNKKGKVLSEVIGGLVAMGYSKEEAKLTVRELAVEEKSTEDLLREALSSLSR
ncbi:MAG: Holliday junction branch migration protein RuvA [Candidatus Magasanikbacteria bacterium]